MSDDEEPDSFIRAVAAAPPMAPPQTPTPRPNAPAAPVRRRPVALLIALPFALPLLLVIAFTLWARSLPTTHVAGPALVGASTQHVSLAPYLDALEDPSRTLTIEDVARPENARRFTPSGGRFGLNYGFTHSAVWGRFSVENSSDAPVERWFIVDTVTVENLEVYRDGEPPAVQGALHPRADRELPRRSYSFRITLAPRQTRTVFVRAWGGSKIQVSFDLWDVGALLENDRRSAGRTTFLYGVMLTMALYNVLLFLFVRDRAHLYYAAQIVSSLAWLGCLDGMLLDVLPARVPMISHSPNIIAAGATYWFSSLFLRRVLGLRETYPRVDRGVLIGLCVMTLVALSFLLGVTTWWTISVALQPIGAAAVAVWIVVAALRWRQGLRAGLWVALAWTAQSSLATVAYLSVAGLLPVPMGLALHLAYTLEAVLFAVALADAARQRNEELARMHRASEVLNEELRRQIADRAGQLATAIARLSTAAPRTLAAGANVAGRYRVIDRLGAGGMGAVYRVHRIADGTELALKILTGAVDKESLARFAREAQVAAQLHHPNIVAVLDVDVSESGMLFLVMELIAGASLATRREQYGDARWAVPILAQIAEALATLHARGIVHRDLKPANVLLDGATAKVADFGLASLAAHPPTLLTPDAAQAPTVPGSGLTQTGAVMGTPLYMAPELATGAREAAPSADVFSFGVLAHELLAAELPFATPPVVDKLSGRPPSRAKLLSDARPDLPAQLCALVDACLGDRPDSRPTADTIARTLGQLAANSSKAQAVQ